MGPDTYAASDEFLALIFADPGLFEDAYTLHGVLLGRGATSPTPYFRSATRCPSPKSRNQGGQTSRTGAAERDGHDEPG